MNKARLWFLCAIIALAAESAPVRAQDKLDGETYKLFGGTYMSDCNNAASPKVSVFAEALVFLNGDKRIAGSNVQAAASWYGRDTPPEYRVALLSEVPGGQQMIFVVNEDRSGYYITLDGDTRVMAAIGKPLTAQKFRRCDVAPKRENATPAQPPKSYKLVELDAGGILLDPKAKSAYHKALGPLVRERWLARLDGPSPQNKEVKVAGAEYVLVSSCKNQDCAQNNLVLLYSAARGVVYGKVFQRGKSTLIGSPSAAIAGELERLWRSEWRQQR